MKQENVKFNNLATGWRVATGEGVQVPPQSEKKILERRDQRTHVKGANMAVIDSGSLVGYCGLYCGTCRIRQGKIKEAVNNLRDIIASYGFDKIMPDLANWEPSFKHYDEFKQVMDGLVKIFGYCAGCFENGGDPNCKVRLCARQKGYRTCTECGEAQSCQKLEPYRKYFESALQSIKGNGIEGYAEKMQKKVDEGEGYPSGIE